MDLHNDALMDTVSNVMISEKHAWVIIPFPQWRGNVILKLYGLVNAIRIFIFVFVIVFAFVYIVVVIIVVAIIIVIVFVFVFIVEKNDVRCHEMIFWCYKYVEIVPPGGLMDYLAEDNNL